MSTMLVSYGWKKRCEVCERRSHAKWHEFARGEINPIALIQFIEAIPSNRDGVTADAACAAIVGYVLAVTSLDDKKMRAELAREALDARLGDQ